MLLIVNLKSEYFKMAVGAIYQREFKSRSYFERFLTETFDYILFITFCKNEKLAFSWVFF